MLAKTLAGKPTFTIVGAGNLGRALAASLQANGYVIDEIVARASAASLRRARRLAALAGAKASAADRARLSSEIVWFCVPDAAIAEAAASLEKSTDWKKKIALHSSGALTSDELSPLKKLGARVASVHPLMTFVRGSQASFVGVPFAIEGDRAATQAARAIVLKLQGKPFAIEKKNKAAYHCWGMFSSPLLVALLAAAERVALAAGIGRKAARDRMTPILGQTLINYERMGAPESSSGPIVRGDVDTVRKHMSILRTIPGAREIYVTLAREALRDLPAKNRSALEKILNG